MASVSTDRRFGVNSGMAIKVPCVAATTANITLSGEQTIDGVACVTDDRVLVKDQTTASENGIWVVDTGSWSRAKDFDDIKDATQGTLVSVVSGTSNSDSMWRVSTSGTITPGTTSIAFENAMYSDSADVAFLQAGTGAVARTTQSKLRDVVSVKDFGAVGDGVTDDTAAIQAALTVSAGNTLYLEGAKTYRYSQLTIPANVNIVTNNSTLDRIAASTSHGIIINGNVTIDRLVITTPGGVSGDKGVSIIGSDVDIGYMSVTAAAQGVYNSTNYALEVESSPAGTQLSRIKIGGFYCKYFSAGMFIKNVTQIDVSNVRIQYYRTAVYLRDISESTFSNVVCALTASTSYGEAGENGLLLESTLSSAASHDLRFDHWSVENAGEHSYRLGGQLSIRDVWFTNCRSLASGSAIVVNNAAATQWSGGCGFKVLGATSVTGEKHHNIFFTGCHVEDVNESYGTFPTGHGLANFSGFLISVASNVHLESCSVSIKDNTSYSSCYGVLIEASDHVYIDNSSFRDMYRHVTIYEEGSVGTYPGLDLPCENVYLNNCEIHSSRAGQSYLVNIGDNAQNFDHTQIHLNKCHLHGASHAVRLEPITGTGSYSEIYLDFTYTGCTADPATATDPVVYGAGDIAVGNIRAPWHPAAYSPSVADGSVWQDTYGGNVLQRAGSVWSRNTTHSVTIANDAFTTVVPPSDRDPGFLMISGSGIAKHMLAWYRASATPASSKYAGAATTTIVNTALTGTTGAVGDITVGVQNDLVYVENRGGSSDTFIISFF